MELYARKQEDGPDKIFKGATDAILNLRLTKLINDSGRNITADKRLNNPLKKQ